MLYRGSNCSLARAMDGRIMRCGIISSCQSAATSEIVKRMCSSWSSALPFTFFIKAVFDCISLSRVYLPRGWWPNPLHEMIDSLT